jgi:hypothetical protein
MKKVFFILAVKIKIAKLFSPFSKKAKLLHTLYIGQDLFLRGITSMLASNATAMYDAIILAHKNGASDSVILSVSKRVDAFWSKERIMYELSRLMAGNHDIDALLAGIDEEIREIYLLIDKLNYSLK